MLRALSPKVDEKFIRGTYQSGQVHDAPWMTVEVALAISKYVSERRFKIKLDDDTREFTTRCLRGAAWLGLECLRGEIFTIVLEDCQKEKPEIYKNSYHALLNLAGRSVEDTDAMFQQLIDMAVAEMPWSEAEILAGKKIKKGMLRPIVEAAAWQVVARVLVEKKPLSVLEEFAKAVMNPPALQALGGDDTTLPPT
ncbi:hypothetical protein ABW20_dc0100226 [Dactylellina cionopaga]|nr:hypothetical protein ABW20_dc0100226 [Dactylellina cionopaga]